jgi:hypothetical protein
MRSTSTSRCSTKKNRPKSKPGIPDLEHSKTLSTKLAQVFRANR